MQIIIAILITATITKIMETRIKTTIWTKIKTIVTYKTTV